jgi:hypothetical protein
VQQRISRSNEWRLAAWITAIDVLIAGGFSIVGLIHPQAVLPLGSGPTQGSLVFAMYAAARSVPLALIVLATVYQRRVQALVVLGFLAGVIQACDCVIGVIERDPGKTVGPLVIAALQFYGVFILNESAHGHVSA